MADRETNHDSGDKPCEAGIFSLTPDGWVVLQRRECPDRYSACRWMKSHTNMLVARYPELRLRASAVTLGGWLTLDAVLADLEMKRKAGDPEFSNPSRTRDKAEDDAGDESESKEA